MVDYLKLFPSDVKHYFSRLKKNNNRLWFEKHRPEYQKNVLEPAMEFVSIVGGNIKKFAPKIVADPRIDKSIFRIYRDVRFSKDKIPYKTHLAIFFWEGSARKIENPGFYIHLDDVEIFVGSGLHIFPKNVLSPFRNIIQDKSSNKKLQTILTNLKKKGFKISGEHYKRMPLGYDPNIKNPHWLLYNGLSVWKSFPNNGKIKDVAELSTQCYKDTNILHKWLVKLCAIS